ncbi:peptidase S41 [Flammeovirga sp. MY04]|uniref:Tricorn protease homolog n=1 Tax=Flammeovirga yaeyamensis TaxID=367791 RepID=D0PQZ7_9BACT|nr:S41 family peptidase [Flammeovirga sp. MY04]ACY02040.1 putative tricorn-like protease [Flammeovirga yaeyamensis]ANQ51435.2 peptidase S41 [Flammeovirga sp. MY04]
MKNFLSLIGVMLLSLTSFAQNPLWLRYPSISPDGTHIAFAYQGDVYVVPTSGGEAKAITTHVAYDFSPVWAPDSKHIAFASDRHGNFDLFLTTVDGGHPQRLTYNSTSEIPSSFTPDGKHVLYTAQILDDVKSAQFPYGRLGELYSVSVGGDRPEQVLTITAEHAQYNADMSKILYQDKKGYEDPWRKHHTSAVTRDLWVYDVNTKKHTQISDFKGEDRTPVFYSNDSKVAYTSEVDGTLNVWTMNADGSNKKQITQLKNHPVRFLSAASNDLFCFGYDGEIYTLKEGEQPKKVEISINSDHKVNNISFQKKSSGGYGVSVSPNGKEVAFILRGDVFVTSTDYRTTVQITNTPEQERSVSFSPDGRSLVYAGERDGSWNIYQAKLGNEDELYFINATDIQEEIVTAEPAEEFQPKWSPKGDAIAYLEERTTLKVINLETKAKKVILPGTFNYSYSDGDQAFDWSPDGKYLAVQYSPNLWTSTDIGLAQADGEGEIINLSQSGYNSYNPRFVMDGKAIVFANDRYGYRSHGSWGAESDVFGIFLTKDAFDEFQLSKEEYELMKEAKEEKEKKEKEANEEVEKSKKKKKGKKDAAEEEEEEDLKIDFDGIQDRLLRLTINSSFLSDFILTKDGDKLYYMSRFEGGYDLWKKDIRKNETKLVLKLNGGGGNLQFDKDGKNIFFETGGTFAKIDVASDSRKNISYSAEYYLDHQAERAYMFEHVWRQVDKKFYDPKLHGVDWVFYKNEYAKYLPFINNNYDYSEMLSEMLGELNGSHTGCRFYPSSKDGDATATLGAFYDANYSGDGLKIVEIMEGSPLAQIETEIKAGMTITSIDGQKIVAGQDYFRFLNHKTGKPTRLELDDNGSKKLVVVKPISKGNESNLLYKRWVKQREKETEEASGGKIGYVHVRGMNSSSFRTVYSEALGKNYKKDALIVDTRFNGGGWLHDDLATFLSGKVYCTFAPRGQKFGIEPINKWSKPSAVLCSEGNYSDAHAFPYTYQTLKIGPLIGMPVPGTMTAVWWEQLQDGSLVFGIPQVGVQDLNGNYLENQQVEPEYKIAQDKDVVVEGEDQQLRKAVEVLMKK